MAVIGGERQARFHGKTLPNISESRHPSTGGGTFSHAPGRLPTAPRRLPTAPGPGLMAAPRGPSGVGGVLHALFHGAPAATQQQFNRAARRQNRRAPSLFNQLATPVTGMTTTQAIHGVTRWLHPGRALAANNRLPQTGAIYEGDLSGAKFLHGAPTPFSEFDYRARNPHALLGGGQYTNDIPTRPGEYAQISPSSKRNNAKWFQARFLDEAAARRFARNQVQLGNEVDGYVADQHFVNANNPTSFVAPMHRQRFAQAVKRIISVNGEFTNNWREGQQRFYDNRAMGGGMKMRLPYRSQVRLPLAAGGPPGSHFVVNYRQGHAPAMNAYAVKPGTRLFDLNAALDPGEAAQAKQLLMQRLRVARAARIRTERGLDEPGHKGKLTPQGEEQFQPTANELRQFDDMERLARLAAGSRVAKAHERTIGGIRTSTDFPPTGRELHRHLNDLLDRHGLSPQGESVVSKDLQHIVSNPNAILRQMGYHGLIDPTFRVQSSPSASNFAGESAIGREIVMFDKHRFEPFVNAAARAAGPTRPVSVRMARALSKHGADFIGAVRAVRSGQIPQASLPLSDELHLNIVKIGNKVRYFASPAKHPDAVGQELNSAQALNLAHRALVVRKGGQLPNGTVTRALVGGKGSFSNPERAAAPIDMGFLAHLLGSQLPDVALQGNKLISRHGYLESGQAGLDAAHEQTLARLAEGVKPPGPPVPLPEILQRLKQRGRQVDLPAGGSINEMKHTMNGVPVPNAEHLNFKVSTAEKTHGMPLTSFPRPPQAHEFFSHGSLVTHLADARTPAEKEQLLGDLNRMLAEAWYGERQFEHTAPHVVFPRFPLRSGYPSFGGLRPDEPSGRGRPPYSLGAAMEPLQRAMKLARQHGLSGQEARLFIRSYLKNLQG